MKIKLTLGSIILGLAFTSTAQITIIRSDFGNLTGTIVINANDSTNLVTLSPGNAGENQTWDLTGLSKDYQDTMHFSSPSGLPCSGNFPMATLAAVSSGIPMYLYDDNTVLAFLGFCGVLFPPDTSSLLYTPPQKQAIFPFTYNTSFSGQSKMILQYALPSPPPDSVRIVQTLTYHSLIDGWGNVITPSGTYSTLRQKLTRYETDSLFGYFTGTGWLAVGTPSNDTTIEYNWWSRNNPFIASITTGGSGNIVSANYLIYSTIGINEPHHMLLPVSVFPNPSSGKFTVALSGGCVNAIDIYTVTGEKVYTGSTVKSQKSQEIDLSGFPKGIYLISIYDGKDTYKKKVVIR
jgi:hypothetical protein